MTKKHFSVGIGLWIYCALCLTTVCCSPRIKTAPVVSDISPYEISLRVLAQRCGIDIGAAVAFDPLQTDDVYTETLKREFTMITPENAMKFKPLHPARDEYDFRQADALVDFAQAHTMHVRGHTLIWHRQLPDWLKNGKWTRDELVEILKEHVTTVVDHYKGRVVAWDVVNEAILSDGSLRDSIWLKGIGPAYIDMAFTWAHETDPNVLLFYNDYNADGLGKKSDAIYSLVKDLLARGVPIHGVGLQMHICLGQQPDPQKIYANIQRMSELGLDVHITEMDVRIKEPVTDTKLAEQADIYQDILEACLATEACKAFVVWGFSDRYSWIPHHFPGWSSGLIFDSSINFKPAYNALVDQLLVSCDVSVSKSKNEKME
ncbi:MAG: endo-1,4-beta-xylanase [bacterium]